MGSPVQDLSKPRASPSSRSPGRALPAPEASGARLPQDLASPPLYYSLPLQKASPTDRCLQWTFLGEPAPRFLSQAPQAGTGSAHLPPSLLLLIACESFWDFPSSPCTELFCGHPLSTAHSCVSDTQSSSTFFEAVEGFAPFAFTETTDREAIISTALLFAFYLLCFCFAALPHSFVSLHSSESLSWSGRFSSCN